MTSLLTHVFAGLLLYLCLERRTRYIALADLLLVAVFSILPDLDYSISRLLDLHLHRKLLHNVFALVSFTGLALWCGRLYTPILMFLPLLHIVLDLVTGCVYLFWPLDNTCFMLCNIWPYIRIEKLSPLWLDWLSPILGALCLAVYAARLVRRV